MTPVSFISLKDLKNLSYDINLLNNFIFNSSKEYVYDIKEKEYIQIPSGSIEEFKLSQNKIDIVYPGIAIVNGYLIINNNNTFPTSELLRHNLQNFPISQPYTGIYLKKPTKIKVIKKKCFVISPRSNYSSFLLGELPRLKHFNNNDELYIHGDEVNYIKEYLDLIKIKNYKFIKKENLINFENLIYVAPTYTNHLISDSSIEFLYKNIKKIKQKFSDRIYLSRSGLGEIHDRKIQNELALEEFLINLDFEIVHPEKLSVEDQISIFQNSKIIISPFGATWANSVFSSKKTKFLMLATKFTPEFARIFSIKRIKLDILKISGIKVRDGLNLSKSFEFIVEEKDYKLIEKWIKKV